jgi:hypothetical protein
MAAMSKDQPTTAVAKTSTEILADLVANRKAAAGRASGNRLGGREIERAAAARSASKSKPALRK